MKRSRLSRKGSGIHAGVRLIPIKKRILHWVGAELTPSEKARITRKINKEMESIEQTLISNRKKLKRDGNEKVKA